MPIIAVAIAIAADVGAGIAVAGAVAAGAVTAATAFGVVAAVGATVGAIGAVTKDKTLSEVGLAIGTVGGIGALASSAGLLAGDASSIFTPAASTADTSGAAVGTMATSTADTFDEAAPAAAASATSTSTGTLDYVAQQANGPVDAGSWDTPAAATPTGTAAGTVAQDSTSPATASGSLMNGGSNAPIVQSDFAVTSETTPAPAPTTAAPPTTPANPLPAAMQSGSDPAAGSGVTSTADTWAETNSGVAGTGNNPAAPGLFANIAAFTKANPLLSYGAVQAAGSLLTGLTSTLTPAQVNALNAQANANNAAAALTQQQTAALAMPKAVASSASVTGTPQTLVPGASSSAPPPTVAASPGLINQAPASAPVTGVPA